MWEAKSKLLDSDVISVCSVSIETPSKLRANILIMHLKKQ